MASPEPVTKHASAGCQAVVGDDAGAVDRLSGLPDALLHAVLSFLPAPQVVRTCVLSRWWRHLWRSAPRINIDEQDFGITFLSFADSEWEIERKNINLQQQSRMVFQCHKLKVIKIVYRDDCGHQLAELLWLLGRSLPDVNIQLTKE
ncbi:hypothetical protein ACP4OV_031121 [Aristida adscensionis]